MLGEPDAFTSEENAPAEIAYISSAAPTDLADSDQTASTDGIELLQLQKDKSPGTVREEPDQRYVADGV
jgi:hypothetical protein